MRAFARVLNCRSSVSATGGKNICEAMRDANDSLPQRQRECFLAAVLTLPVVRRWGCGIDQGNIGCVVSLHCESDCMRNATTLLRDKFIPTSLQRRRWFVLEVKQGFGMCCVSCAACRYRTRLRQFMPDAQSIKWLQNCMLLT